MKAAAHADVTKRERACCSHESTDADHGKPSGDNKKHDCEHCRGAHALIAQQAGDQAHAFKPLAATVSPLIQATGLASPGVQLPGFSQTFTLERPPPHLFVWHCAFLN
jgi:hypothetical protein